MYLIHQYYVVLREYVKLIHLNGFSVCVWLFFFFFCSLSSAPSLSPLLFSLRCPSASALYIHKFIYTSHEAWRVQPLRNIIIIRVDDTRPSLPVYSVTNGNCWLCCVWRFIFFSLSHLTFISWIRLLLWLICCFRIIFIKVSIVLAISFVFVFSAFGCAPRHDKKEK